MIKVDFLISGRIGFDVLKTFVETFSSNAINKVVTSTINDLSNDANSKLIELCKNTNIELLAQENFVVDPNIFRLVIGDDFILVPDGKTIVLHNSLLPRFRGKAALVNCLINGEKELGVTAFVAINDDYEGPVIRQESFEIMYPLTMLEVMDLVTPLYVTLCAFVYEQIKTGSVKAFEQDHYLATYCLWRDDQDLHISWTDASDKIKRLIDATRYPYEGAKAMLNNEPIAIKAAEIFGDVVIENRDPGKVIFIKNNCPVVVCGDGLIKITEAYFTNTGNPVIPFSKIQSRFR